jgi:four helix bundle protein
MARAGFENLEVYRLSEVVADEVWEMVNRWRNLAKDTVGKQLIRSADSIGANIAEGEGRFHYKDNCRFIRIARGSLNETRHWLRRAYKRRLLTQQQTARLRPLLAELAPRLNAYLKSVASRTTRKPRVAASSK